MLNNLKNARFGTKSARNGPNQVHKVPFGLILHQDRSHKVWDAAGMPPGAPWGPPRSSWGPPGISCGVAALKQVTLVEKSM